MLKEWLKTIAFCGVFCVIGSAIVFPLWPHLSALCAGLRINFVAFALAAAFFMLVVVTHMKRGQIDSQGVPFSILYGIACMFFCGSTLLPTQYNAGTAVIEMAFCLMLGWDIYKSLTAKQLTEEQILAKVIEFEKKLREKNGREAKV
jgi:membrane protein implicated in regulation of membrane protease activity